MSIANPASYNGYFYVRAGNSSPNSIKRIIADSTEIETYNERAIYKVDSGSTKIEPDNEKIYGTIYKAIKCFAEEVDEPSGIDQETAREAIDWTLKLRDSQVPPPKIFSHGGDAVVFVWESVDRRLYMTPCGQNVSLFIINRAGEDEIMIDVSKTTELRKLLIQLGGKA